MSKKILSSIVIFLAILIVFCFIALIYGMYLKISTNTGKLDLNIDEISLNLDNHQKILDIEVIDKNRLLIKIESFDNMKGLIYNLNEKKIIEIIDK